MTEQQAIEWWQQYGSQFNLTNLPPIQEDDIAVGLSDRDVSDAAVRLLWQRALAAADCKEAAALSSLSFLLREMLASRILVEDVDSSTQTGDWSRQTAEIRLRERRVDPRILI